MQEKMAASQKCFEDQKCLTFYPIQPLSWGSGEGGGVFRRLVLSNQSDG